MLFARSRPCSCGSGKSRRPVYDAAGIFACYVCDACERERRGVFRPEVLEAFSDWVQGDDIGDDLLEEEEDLEE